LQSSTKYLGFFLNHNDYTKRYKRWMISKVGRILSIWCNRWLSRGGRLVLVKPVLEVIPMYWVSLSFIPKVVLE
jgi:hypothetical protein